ncbi:MAG: 4-hydroxy-3-methylbut-2-enyl diphosphate reductase [Chloroflexi bacterium]|nr:4-hydroxy-3-methylbut-2-enyl diphosphate reductase [Chloroflexota bacterium]
MQIEKASLTGFCFGVRRALNMMEKAAAEKGGIASLGDLVHNRQVVDYLESLGVRVICNLEESQGGAVAIPSHGAGPEVFQEIEARKLPLVDATCPIVSKAQRKARDLRQAGFQVVIFGDPDHPEVRAVLAWAGEGALAITEPEALLARGKIPRRLGIMAQTTQTPKAFSLFVAKLSELALAQMTELRVVNTLCPSVHLRQQAAQELARRVDLMIVVGGHHSANTRRLAEVCREAGCEARHIETVAEVDAAWLHGKERIGVAAGTSTPDQAVEAVMARLQELAGQSR